MWYILWKLFLVKNTHSQDLACDSWGPDADFPVQSLDLMLRPLLYCPLLVNPCHGRHEKVDIISFYVTFLNIFCFLLQGLLTIIFIASGRPSMKFLRWEWKWWNRERFRINCRRKKEPLPMGPLECCCRWGFRNIFWNQTFHWGCCTVLHERKRKKEIGTRNINLL